MSGYYGPADVERDFELIGRIREAVRMYRESHINTPDVIEVPPGLLPDHALTVFGLTVHVSPLLPAGSLYIMEQERRDDLTRAIAEAMKR